MNSLLSVVLLQSSSGGGMGGLIVPMVLIFAVMYFLIFRPQAKKQKQQQAMINALEKGDKVVTAGGLYGKIVGIKENDKTLLIEIAEKVKVEITRSSVARTVEPEKKAEKQLEKKKS